jgi:hypothetical protein
VSEQYGSQNATIKITVLTLASTSNALPDDGVTAWWIKKNFANIKMHGTYVKKLIISVRGGHSDYATLAPESLLRHCGSQARNLVSFEARFIEKGSKQNIINYITVVYDNSIKV